MQRFLLILSSTLLITTGANAQMKVANYSFGNPGTATYEHVSFWIKDGQRATINYAYGKDRKEVQLAYLGKDMSNGKAGFSVQFTNKHILHITPTRQTLTVTDSAGKYRKTFTWEYEGPVNGIGTFCAVCAQDEKEAISLIQRYYLK